MTKNQLNTGINTDAEYIINLALGYQISQVLFAAIDMNIFTILESGPRKIEEIAEAVGSDKQSLRRLVNALVALNLLETKDGMFLNSNISSQYLVKGNKGYLGNAIHHDASLWDFWEGMEKQIKSGKGKQPDDEYLGEFPHRLKDYLSAMNDFAELKSDMIADAISINKYRKMLDVGCGPGTYAINFVERNPLLDCTIIDLKPNLAYAREVISKSGYQDRISVLPCQILEDEIPGDGYDLIFISNLIHIYGEIEVRKIVEKIWNKAAISGEIIIHDYILDEDGHGPLGASLFDINMFVGTPNGKCYTALEIKELLKELGAKNVRQIPVGLGSSLVIGEKK